MANSKGSDLRAYHPTWACLGFLAISVIAICLLFRDFGITWDEPIHNNYGIRVLNYYKTNLEDKSAIEYGKRIIYYGSAFDLAAAFLNDYSPLGEYETRHLLNAFVGLLGILGTWKLAKHLAGPRAAILSAFLLAFTPAYLGHMFNNPKDIPFAAGYVWSLTYILMSLRYFPRLPVGLTVKLGLAIGLTLGIRVGGLLLWGYFGLAALTYIVAPEWITGSSPYSKSPAKRLTQLAGYTFVAFLISYIVMLFFWPWAQINPFLRPIEALLYVSNFDWRGIVLLGGEYIRGYNLPWNYLPEYFLVKMPELIVSCVGLSVVLAGRYLIRGRSENWKPQAFQYFLLVFAILFPFIYAILKKSTLYDGIRHFLFVLPCISVICGVALSKLIEILKKSLVSSKIVLNSIIVLIFIPQVYAIVKLHPYQYIYYNAFVGGVRGAEGVYETDYWCHSYKEAAALLCEYLKHTEGNSFGLKEYRIKIKGPVYSASHYFPKNLRAVKKINRADFLISCTRGGMHKSTHGIQIAAVERSGVVLSVIKDVRTIY